MTLFYGEKSIFVCFMSDSLCHDDNKILSTLLLTGDNNVEVSIEVAELLFCVLHSRGTAS
jgi:hypothetical protein